MIHLNAFTQCSICPQSKGQWKHPLDRSSTGYRDLDYYAEMARTLERGRFDALFFADIHGTYDAFRGTRDAAVRHVVQFPCNDPTVLIPALSMVTRHLGFATTYSTTYHPPYQAAKGVVLRIVLPEHLMARFRKPAKLDDTIHSGLGRGPFSPLEEEPVEPKLKQASAVASKPESSGRDPTGRNSIRAGSASHRRGRPIVLEIQTTLPQRIGELAKKLPSASATDRGSIICSM